MPGLLASHHLSQLREKNRSLWRSRDGSSEAMFMENTKLKKRKKKEKRKEKEEERLE
jgi:hypothetical protein